MRSIKIKKAPIGAFSYGRKSKFYLEAFPR
jgi:hypothetical protein